MSMVGNVDDRLFFTVFRKFMWIELAVHMFYVVVNFVMLLGFLFLFALVHVFAFVSGDY